MIARCDSHTELPLRLQLDSNGKGVWEPRYDQRSSKSQTFAVVCGGVANTKEGLPSWLSDSSSSSSAHRSCVLDQSRATPDELDLARWRL
eukprot:3397050-Rhodomonas_salina.5